MQVALQEVQQAYAIWRDTWPRVKEALQAGKKLTLTIKEEKRSLSQNSRLWAMLSDISRQVDWYGRKLSPDDWKIMFTASLRKQDVVPGIDSGFVVLGLSTSKMTKQEMSDLQALMEAFGADKGVKFRAQE